MALSPPTTGFDGVHTVVQSSIAAPRRKAVAHPDRLVSLLPRLKRDRLRAAPELLPALPACAAASAAEPTVSESLAGAPDGNFTVEELAGAVSNVL